MFHTLDERLCLVGRRVGGAADERRRAAQAADQVLAEIGVVPHTGECERMQGLQHQRREAAGKHARKIRVHAPGGAVGTKQAGLAHRMIVVHVAATTTRKRAQHPAPDGLAGRAGEEIPG
jgi:hypothetical protein